MPIDPETREALETAVWLVNSQTPSDGLNEVCDLENLLDKRNYAGRFDRDDEELHAVRASRTQMHRMLTAAREEAHVLINAVLQTHNALPRLRKNRSGDWHTRALDLGMPLPHQLLVELAMAMCALVIADETSRIGICHGRNCNRLHIDLSRNKSRRFCSQACSNRTSVAAYRQRQNPRVTQDRI